MSYTITKTNGVTLTTIVDGTVDQSATDIVLIGKNSSSYGTYLNDNFVHLLENFSNSSEPNNPITGQLWFDTTENRIKVYDGTRFKVSGGTIVANSAPSGIVAGDLWINSATEQLFFNDGIQTVLAGPLYTAAQGQTGFVVSTILDTNNIEHTIAYLYVAQTLIGIFSKDAFTPGSAIAGFTGSIVVGFNVGNTSGTKFNVPTSSAYSLIAPNGDLKTTSSFVTATGNNSLTGTVSIQNNTPLVLGANSNNQIETSTTILNIKSNTSDQNFQVSTLVGSTLSPAIFANATSQRVGIYTNTPATTLDVAGDLTVRGTLNVLGTTTTVSSTNLIITDKLITIGSTATPTDTTANDAGIEIPGATTKTFTWKSSTPAWTSSDNLNLVSGKTYKINGFDVITATALGSAIVSAPGLNSIGTLTALTAGTLTITTNTLTATQTNSNLVLAPNGTGTVDVSSKKITSVATPVAGTDATNKTYVDTSIQSAPLAIGLTTTNFTNAQVATTFLTDLFPAGEHQNGTYIRAFCIDQGTTETVTAGSFITGSKYQIISVGNTNFTLISATTNSPGAIFVASGAGSGSGTAAPVVRTFRLVTGTWTYQGYS
jgi:hypothetical protein